MNNIVRIWKRVYQLLEQELGNDRQLHIEFINAAVLYTLAHYHAGKIDMRTIRKLLAMSKLGFTIEDLCTELGLQPGRKIEKTVETVRTVETRTMSTTQVQSLGTGVVIENVGTGEETDHVLLRDNPWISIIRSRFRESQ